MPAIFRDPDHDHARCSAGVMIHAEAACAERAQRLTGARRKVLEVLASSHKPMGAYEIIDRIARKKVRPAPIIVYRALAFLIEQGFAHRIESRNAYVACVQKHGEDGMVAFLMCDTCGTVGETSTPAMAEVVAALAKKARFRQATSVIEVTGTCAHCRRDSLHP